ncbi:MAG: YbaK/EbsC family protein [Caldilineaceae bacterium]|nr:YbaK/EbsC family protein [Caldilineaceae bacterium]
MSADLSNSAQRVQEFLREQGFDFTVRELPGSTRTAQEAAESIGCTVAQIAKSLIFRDEANDQPVLVVASGVNRVDVKKLEAATGLKLGKAGGSYVKERTGFAIGGVPPAGHLTPLTTFLDPDLQQYDVIWAAAGTPFAVFELTPDSLAALTGGRWVEMA